MDDRKYKDGEAETILILKGISLPYTEPSANAVETAERKLKKAGLPVLSAEIHKRSVDARKKNDIRFVYSVQATVRGKCGEKRLRELDASPLVTDDRIPESGIRYLRGRVVVVGFGPCGMFAALRLARAGYRPIVIERGDDIEKRTEAAARFMKTGELDEESNVQFGAGGAGSFSDGKLVTRIGDPLAMHVLRTYREFGAPKSILTLAKPHIGTDLLFGVTAGVDREIRRLGGEIFYRTKLTGLRCDSSGRVVSALTSEGEIPCGALILAVGHSARDTYGMLLKEGFSMVGKDFSVGARVEHLQKDIDRAMYGDADVSILGHAEYTLSLREGRRGVYSFCMCPGGEVICASSESGGLVVNGMSRYSRDGRNANAAIAVSVLKEDYGSDPMKGIEFQRSIERKAFESAGGGYRAPIQTLSDFMNGRSSREPSRVLPTFRGGSAVSLCDLGGILPQGVVSLMKRGFDYFETRIRGFAAPDALLTGVETRTSAPLRILREDDMTAPGRPNFYPCGEGAGYAGGITSAAVDGLRAANAVISEYMPPQVP